MLENLHVGDYTYAKRKEAFEKAKTEIVECLWGGGHYRWEDFEDIYNKRLGYIPEPEEGEEDHSERAYELRKPKYKKFNPTKEQSEKAITKVLRDKIRENEEFYESFRSSTPKERALFINRMLDEYRERYENTYGKFNKVRIISKFVKQS